MRQGGLRRPARAVLRALLLVTLVATSVVGNAGSSGAQAAPAVTVSPSSVAPGGTVTVSTSGFPPGPTGSWELYVCPSSDAASPSITRCWNNRSGSGSVPAQIASVAVPDEIGTAEPLRCSRVPGGCVVVVTQTVSGAVRAASAPIEVVVPPWRTDTPTWRHVSGDAVAITTSGFPAGPGAIGVCFRGATASTALSQCEALATFPAGLPATATLRVPRTFTAGGTAMDCRYTCSLSAWVTDASGTQVVAYDYRTVMIFPPRLAVTPTEPSADPQPVTVSGRGYRPGPVEVVVCPGTGAFRRTACGLSTPAQVDDGWMLSVGLTIPASFPTGEDPAASCDPCTVRLLGADGAPLGSALYAGDPPLVRTVVPGPVRPQGIGAARLPLPEGAEVTGAQCALPLGPDVGSSRCTDGANLIVSAGGVALDLFAGISPTFPTSSGTVDCQVESCVVAIFDDLYGTPVVVSDPLLFDPPTMTGAPTAALIDGDEMQVQVAGLDRARSYVLVVCKGGRCAADGEVVSATSDDTGRIDVSVPVRQRLATGYGSSRRWLTCRTGCSVAIGPNRDAPLASVGYTLATPSVSASPATDLSDGDTLTVAGSGLQPTYAGPTVLFPTGGWALVQCDAAVGASPNIVQVFQSCAVVPGGGTVNVPGSTSSTDVEVQGAIDHILGGGTTDCTASPNACVVGLTRWEQDGSTSAVFTPVTFT